MGIPSVITSGKILFKFIFAIDTFTIMRAHPCLITNLNLGLWVSKVQWWSHFGCAPKQ